MPNSFDLIGTVARITVVHTHTYLIEAKILDKQARRYIYTRCE